VSVEILAGPLLSLLLGYLLGSIPFGLVLTRLFGAGDLRATGSGNIGATNVLRTGRKGLAAATLLLDMLKASAALLIVATLFPGRSHEQLAAIGAFMGHLYPVWLRFRGGKGVATFLGIILGFVLVRQIHWSAAVIYALVWLGTLALTRYSSLAGMAAALVAPVVAALLGRFDLALLFLGFTLLTLWKHRGNVERLLAGVEPRIGGSADG
jgi:glycerol-3-phosphate acyltransferase PlsY